MRKIWLRAIVVFVFGIFAANAYAMQLLLNYPSDYETISGNYLFNLTLGITDHADNVTFYWSNDSGISWNPIYTVVNDTYPDAFFEYLWDSTTVSDGYQKYSIAAVANDNMLVADKSENLTVDNLAPVITNINTLQNAIINGSYTISFDVFDATSDYIGVTVSQGDVPSAFVCSWDGNTKNSCSLIWDTNSTDGSASIDIYANDSFSRESTTQVNVTIDNSAPIIQNINMANNGFVKGNKTISFEVVEAAYDVISFGITNGTLPSAMSCSGGGGSIIISCSTDWSTDDLNGPATIYFYANDSFSREVLEEINVTIDNIKPNITEFELIRIGTIETGLSLAETDFNCTATDNYDTNLTVNITGLDTSSAGDKNATCTVTDDAGNSDSKIKSYTVVQAQQQQQNTGSSSGGGSGGGGFVINNKPVETAPVVQETPQVSGSRLYVTLSLGQSYSYKSDSGEHTIKVTKITNSIVEIKVASNPVLATFGVGETKGFDTDGDEMPDLEVTLVSKTLDSATLGIKQITEKAPELKISVGEPVSLLTGSAVADWIIGELSTTKRIMAASLFASIALLGMLILFMGRRK